MTEHLRIYWGKDSLFNKWCWENWTTYTKESNWATVFRLKKTNENFLDIGLGNDIFGYDTKGKGNKSGTVKQMGSHQTKNFCTTKEATRK